MTINGEPVPEVLVSLSGSEVSNRKYRKHAATAGDGVVMFAKLDPGAFYLRASLKEFSFDPPFADVIVQDGRHMVSCSTVYMRRLLLGRLCFSMTMRLD